MKWVKPNPVDEKGRPILSHEWFLDSRDPPGFRICKAMVPGPIYTASRQGVLLRSGTLAECKAACEAEVERRAA